MPDQNIVTIGNYDGVHVGHRAIIAQAATLGKQLGAPITALTFDPHPATVLNPSRVPPRIMSRTRKIEALRGAGADHVHVLDPTPQRLGMPPADFIEWVIEQYHPVGVVEGPDFRFGKDRVGDVSTLRSLGQAHGFAVHVVDRVDVPLHDQLITTVSSSLIRWLISQGRVADGARCLGEPFTVVGEVVRGKSRGKSIGVPTANIQPDPADGFLIPRNGVYAGRVCVCGDRDGDDSPSYRAAINVGPSPTFGQLTSTVEAHLLDFEGDLYGQTIAISFLRWMRDQQSFPSVETLTSQLRRDINLTRRWNDLGLLPQTPDIRPETLISRTT